MSITYRIGTLYFGTQAPNTKKHFDVRRRPFIRFTQWFLCSLDWHFYSYFSFDLSWLETVSDKNAGKTVYLTMYAIPALCLIHAIFGGLICEFGILHLTN